MGSQRYRPRGSWSVWHRKQDACACHARQAEFDAAFTLMLVMEARLDPEWGYVMSQMEQLFE